MKRYAFIIFDKKPYTSTSKDGARGFTLVELSIVLIIIGLIVGGILAGADMIRAAKIRSVISDVQQYKTAINVFRDKYSHYPGDMPNATDFWGAINTGGSNGNCSAPLTDQGTGTQTCNGDGNREVLGTSSWSEVWLFWKHLENAGLAEGGFSGNQGSSGPSYPSIGVNSPSLSIDNSTLAYRYNGNVSANVFRLGKGEGIDDPILTPTESLNLDTKIDDGAPDRGKVWTYPNVTRPNCTTGDSASYQLTFTDVGCNLFITHR